MKNRVKANRSRMAKVVGSALAAVLIGTVVPGGVTQAASKPAAVKKGGFITMAIDGGVGGHCFQNALASGALGSSRSMFEQLFERTNKGKFVGFLAESATSTDNRVWNIKLRAGIKYSNGEAFNAANVKQNIDIGRGDVDPTLGFLGTGVAVNANIYSVEVVDDLNLKVTLDRPDTQFMALIYRAGRYVMRAPAQIASPKTCVTNPIGTGPFMLKSFTTDLTEVVRNPNYWRKDKNGVQLPYLDGITFINVKEASQRAAAVRKGTVDAALFTQGDATFTQDLLNRKKDVTGYQSLLSLYGQWVPNVGKKDSPFKIKACRLAAAHALDWNAYNKVRLKGTGSVTGSIVGKENPMYTLKGAPKFSIAKSKAYQVECNAALGAAGPMKLTLYADSSSQSLNNVKFIRQMLDKAGIATNEILQAESTILISKIYAAGGNAYDFAQGTPAEGASPAYVAPFFMSKAFPTGSTNPILARLGATLVGRFGIIIALGNHGDTKVDDLTYAAMAETNPTKSKLAWQAVTEYLQTEGYAIPAVHGGVKVFVSNKSKLQGIGKLELPSGGFQDIVENKGIEWAGVSKG
jgi:ABC-type transport system substrate-binding protein